MDIKTALRYCYRLSVVVPVQTTGNSQRMLLMGPRVAFLVVREDREAKGMLRWPLLLPINCDGKA